MNPVSKLVSSASEFCLVASTGVTSSHRCLLYIAVSRSFLMTAPADFQLTSLESTDLPSATAAPSLNGFLQGLGSELVFTQNASGQYIGFYWQASQRYGLTSDRVVGRELSHTFGPVATDAYLAQIKRILERRIPERGIYEFACGGQSFVFELTISPILPPDGTATAVLVMGCQSHQAKEAIALVDPDTHERLVASLARNIRRTLDLDTIWQQTVMGLGKALNVSSCIICSYKPDNTKIQVEAEYSQPQLRSMLGEKFVLADEPELSKALETLEPVVMNGDKGSSYKERSALAIATCDQDQPNGLIVLYQSDRQRQWTLAELDMVRELADQVGTVIAHATLYKELEAAREQAEEASRLKSQFLANTSHELRTPLNGMIGFLKLILDDIADDPEEQREFIQEAYNSALHLLNIINDILDIARIEAGKMDLDMGPVKLQELFSNVENFTGNQAHQKNLSFNIDMPATHDEIILYGNYQRLLQVMLNLVGNAIKFTHEGGVTVSAEVIKKKVKFAGQELPGMVKVQVADTGIGVSLVDQDKLFQSFSQVDGERTRTYGGTGLGLAISQKLMEAMGGVVNFYSMGEGLGSTVTFTIPLFQEPLMVSTS